MRAGREEEKEAAHSITREKGKEKMGTTTGESDRCLLAVMMRASLLALCKVVHGSYYSCVGDGSSGRKSIIVSH